MKKNGIVYRMLAKLKLNVLDRTGFYKTRSRVIYRYRSQFHEPILIRDNKLFFRKVNVGGKYYSCNPSIVAVDGGYIAVVRTVNYRLVHNGWYVLEGPKHDTRNYIVKMDSQFSIFDQTVIDDSFSRNGCPDAVNGFEDLRIFIWKSEIWTLGNACNFDSGRNVMALQRISNGHVVENYLIKSPFSAAKEKNWMPFVKEGRLFAVYSLNPLIVVEIDKGHCQVRIEKKLDLSCELFGSSQVVRWKDGWICVVHERSYVEKAGRFYKHRFLYVDDNWNFKLSDPFCWKNYGVEFCCGLAHKGNIFSAAISVHDRHAFFVEIDEKVVESLLFKSERIDLFTRRVMSNSISSEAKSLFNGMETQK